MPIEPWDADDLAGLLMGMEDAKKELIRLHTLRQEGDPSMYASEIVDAAERWNALANSVSDWPEVSNSTDLSAG